MIQAEAFEALASSTNGIAKLRELILELAVRGLLIPQDPNDEPSLNLIKRIQREKTFKPKSRAESEEIITTVEDVPFAVPRGWQWIVLADYALDISTGPFGSALHKSDYVLNGIPLVNPSHMVDSRIKPDWNVTVTEETANRLNSYRMKPGDIVMARRGEVGRSAMVTDVEDGWLCGTGSFFIRFTDEIFREYVLLLMRSMFVRKFLAGEAVGITMVNLNHGILKKLPIAIPPLDEQHRIVNKVDELMALCDQLDQRQNHSNTVHQRLLQTLLESLTQAADNEAFQKTWSQIAAHFDTLFTTEASIDQLKQVILQLAVMGKLVPQDSNDEPASVLLNRINAEKQQLIKEGKIKKQQSLPKINNEDLPFRLPRGWAAAYLSDLLNVLNGRAYKKGELLDAGVPVLRVGNLFTSNHWYYSDLQLEDDKYCNKGDLIYSWSASFGPFIWEGPKVIYHYHIWKLDLYDTNNLSKYFIYNYLLEKTQEIKASGNGIAMIHMTKEKMEKLIVPLPPLVEQHRIVAKVDELMAICDQLKSRINKSQQTQEHLATAIVEKAAA